MIEQNGRLWCREGDRRMNRREGKQKGKFRTWHTQTPVNLAMASSLFLPLRLILSSWHSWLSLPSGAWPSETIMNLLQWWHNWSVLWHLHFVYKGLNKTTQENNARKERKDSQAESVLPLTFINDLQQLWTYCIVTWVSQPGTGLLRPPWVMHPSWRGGIGIYTQGKLGLVSLPWEISHLLLRSTYSDGGELKHCCMHCLTVELHRIWIHPLKIKR